jgi:hypothetical protein
MLADMWGMPSAKVARRTPERFRPELHVVRDWTPETATDAQCELSTKPIEVGDAWQSMSGFMDERMLHLTGSEGHEASIYQSAILRWAGCRTPPHAHRGAFVQLAQDLPATTTPL